MPHAPKHSVSVGAIVADDQGRILLVRRRDTGAWVIPGGVLELHETVLDGVVRETLEETGLTVRPARLTGVYKNLSTGVVSLVFYCRILEGELRSNTDETSDATWVSPDDVNALATDAFAVRVADAVADSDGIPVRSLREPNIMTPRPTAH